MPAHGTCWKCHWKPGRTVDNSRDLGYRSYEVCRNSLQALRLSLDSLGVTWSLIYWDPQVARWTQLHVVLPCTVQRTRPWDLG